jgi:hypothetical protein
LFGVTCSTRITRKPGASAKSIASYCVPKSNMLASIILDQSFPHYTNLDYISGKVFVRTQTATTVSSIVVKLEGESRTRLLVRLNSYNMTAHVLIHHDKCLADNSTKGSSQSQ